jgi:hypothetical protein
MGEEFDELMLLRVKPASKQATVAPVPYPRLKAGD